MVTTNRMAKKIVNKIRRLRFFFKRRKIINRDVTIISNTCLAGVVYNTLDLEFMSPTINLSIWGIGFIHFVKHLKEYVEKGYFVNLHKKTGFYFGPHALLKCNGLPDVDVVFTHYKEFDEAVAIWNRRSKRINYSKIFLLVEARFEDEKNLIKEYLSLPYRKAILTYSCVFEDDCIKNMEFYRKHGNNKSITEFISIFGKRGIDEYDFVNDIFNREYD